MKKKETPPYHVPQPGLGLRFSLATMFMLLIIVALIGSNLFTTWDLRRTHQVVKERDAEISGLQTEIEHYQDQLGILRVNDETKTHLIAMETFEETVWRWRVFVPDGEKYHVNVTLGDVPRQDYPEPTLFTVLEPGETRLTISLKKGPDGDWRFRAERSQGKGTSSMSTTINAERMAWYARSGHSSTMEFGPSKGQAIFEVDHPIELIRHRSWPQGKPGEKVDTSKSADGLLLWLEPVEDSARSQASVP